MDDGRDNQYEWVVCVCAAFVGGVCAYVRVCVSVCLLRECVWWVVCLSVCVYVEGVTLKCLRKWSSCCSRPPAVTNMFSLICLTCRDY